MAFKERSRIVEPEMHFEEKPVRFSFAKCDTNKWCVQNLDKQDLQAFYKRMGYFESCTWGTVRKMPRENGISIDKKESLVYKRLNAQQPGISTFGHFRVNGTDANIRIFVGLNSDLGYILRIDRDGEMQH